MKEEGGGNRIRPKKKKNREGFIIFFNSTKLLEGGNRGDSRGPVLR